MVVARAADPRLAAALRLPLLTQQQLLTQQRPAGREEGAGGAPSSSTSSSAADAGTAAGAAPPPGLSLPLVHAFDLLSLHVWMLTARIRVDGGRDAKFLMQFLHEEVGELCTSLALSPSYLLLF